MSIYQATRLNSCTPASAVDAMTSVSWAIPASEVQAVSKGCACCNKIMMYNKSSFFSILFKRLLHRNLCVAI